MHSDENPPRCTLFKAKTLSPTLSSSSSSDSESAECSAFGATSRISPEISKPATNGNFGFVSDKPVHSK